MMKLKKLAKSYGLGVIITLVIFVLLEDAGMILIPEDAWGEKIIIFSFWSILFTLPVYHFSYLKKHKKKVFQIFALFAFLTMIVMIDEWMDTPDNPVTLISLAIFWIAVAYLIMPEFIKKYRYVVLVVYLCISCYFLYVRLLVEDLETYVREDKEAAIFSFIIPIPFFIALWVYEQWRWFRSLKSAKTNAELQLLKTQVNPHFFFNTLNNLYALTVSHSEKAPEVILKLSDIMRYTIYEGKKDFVTLEDEIQFLENYLALHQIRYHKNVDIQFIHTISENVAIAPLLLVILLENAIKHGTEKLRSDAYIHMDLTYMNDEIRFEIENNFDPEEVTSENGIGLENLKRRLELIYKDTYELNTFTEENIYRAELLIRTK